MYVPAFDEWTIFWSLQLFCDFKNHVPVTRDVILAIDNYCRTYTEDVVQFINDVDLARIIASALNNSINDTCSVTKDKFDNVETISE